jgi:hypothetical protein
MIMLASEKDALEPQQVAWIERSVIPDDRPWVV